MPRAAMEKLQKALVDVMNKPEHAAFNLKYGLEYENLTMEQTNAFLQGELERMTGIAKRANIKLE